MTRSQFARIGFFTTALTGIVAVMTIWAPEARASLWPIVITTRSLACWSVGCPSLPGSIKCADITLEAENKMIGSASVTYYCYLTDKSQPEVVGPPEGEM